MAAEELSVENVLLKETPAAAILFDDAVDKVKAPKKRLQMSQYNFRLRLATKIREFFTLGNKAMKSLTRKSINLS